MDRERLPVMDLSWKPIGKLRLGRPRRSKQAARSSCTVGQALTDEMMGAEWRLGN